MSWMAEGCRKSICSAVSHAKCFLNAESSFLSWAIRNTSGYCCDRPLYRNRLLWEQKRHQHTLTFVSLLFKKSWFVPGSFKKLASRKGEDSSCPSTLFNAETSLSLPDLLFVSDEHLGQLSALAFLNNTCLWWEKHNSTRSSVPSFLWVIVV